MKWRLGKHLSYDTVCLCCIVFSIRHHTLVLTNSKRVYSFGCGEQGQLGHGEESHSSVPLPVQLQQGNYTSKTIQLNDKSCQVTFISRAMYLKHNLIIKTKIDSDVTKKKNIYNFIIILIIKGI